MQHTMKAIVKRAARNVYEMDLQAFIFSHPAQTALLGIQFQWTADMQANIKPMPTTLSVPVQRTKAFTCSPPILCACPEV